VAIAWLTGSPQIDLEGSDDDIREIQQEISLLSTCASSYVTQYKASFVKGVKLWIVMEYLGGGSCLDLVWHYNTVQSHLLSTMLTPTAQTRIIHRITSRNRLSRAPLRPRLPPPDWQDPSRYQSRQHFTIRKGQSQDR
jgi:serine/threonine protein kinase